MRLILWLTPLTLAACATPALQPAPTGVTQSIAAPFDVPMDPGAISCQSLNNPTALAAAVDWTMGQARAGILSGRTSSVPDASNLSSNLVSFCSENGQSTVRTAATQIGI
ncbi:MAG: hypothetical protein ACSHWY_03605 [Octadecabacter sp.]